MPEIKNIFTSGRMNKSLDERLVSKDEYRDALNVDVVTSEGSDIGSLQTIRGNTKVTEFKDDDNGAAIVGQQCIGSIRHTKTDKIYWFIAGTSIDAIVEYDCVANSHLPILVSVKATEDVLQFSTDNLITGVNIIGDLMFFTDDKSEPKCINIEQCRKGCSSTDPYSTHTKFWVDGEDKGNIKEEYVTTIKKYPLNAPTLKMARTKDANRDGASECQLKDSSHFVLGTTQRELGTSTGYLKFQPAPNFKTGDIIKLTSPKDDVNLDDEEHVVRVKLTGAPDRDAAGTYVRFRSIILSISPNLQTTGTIWDAKLEKEDPIFGLQFPRFAYRWKYVDGEYSAFSPFSEPAFLPSDEIQKGIFHAKDGYNLTMTNNLRSLVLEDFDTRPKGCVEVDILVKQANDTNVYTIKTLTDEGEKEELNTVESGGTGFEVLTEQVHAVLPSNQLLRPWDNVPRLAKAQEVTANRVVYGNYLQNFDLEGSQPIFEPYLITKEVTTDNINIGKPSLKSIRTYQVGVVFLDEYGRQTPVITDDSAIVKVSQADSNKQNELNCKISGVGSSTFTAPSWATHYKYFVKENSGPYYNLAVDRFYTAEDGNMWLSFPSSDRNKVDEETYLILKKSHAEDVAAHHNNVATTLKYKIIAIDNSVPSFLSKKKVSLGTITTNFGKQSSDKSGFPSEGFFYFNVPGPEIARDGSPLKDLPEDSVGGKYIRISGSQNSSDYYQIDSIEPMNVAFMKQSDTYPYSDVIDSNDSDTKDVGDYWKFKIKKPFGKDIAFGKTDGGTELENLTLEVFKEEEENNKPEFDGRFFVKINKDNYLEKYIVANEPEAKYSVLLEEKLSYITPNSMQIRGLFSYFEDSKCFSIDKAAFVKGVSRGDGSDDPDMLSVGKGTSGSDTIELRYTHIGEDGNQTTKNPSDGDFKTTAQADFGTALSTPGTLLRFKHDDSFPDGDGRVYEIDGKPTLTNGYNFLKPGGGLRWIRVMRKASAKGLRYTIKLDKKLNWNPLTKTSDSTPLVAAPLSSGIEDHRTTTKGTTVLQVVQKIEDGDSFSTTSPAIFETEPKERVDLDIYHETEQTFAIADIGDTKTLKWYNCFSYGTGLESNRIRDDFNQVFMDKGPKVSTVFAEQYKEERRDTGMIYSGLFNSTSGVNRLNQFIQAEKITKDVNPSYGSIQKLYSRDSDLVVFCEDKCLKVLANKDAIYNADGNINLTATENVLGQAIPFVGEYGISKNPESFAAYAFRSYWADKARGAILRLSRDGITNISNKGMRSYFADNLKGDKVLPGGYDEDKDLYNITLKPNNNSITGSTISYAENVGGWTSRKTFIPQSSLSINGIYYSIYVGDLWKHNDASADYNSFYGSPVHASVKFIFNDQPSSIKNFKTLNYEGTQPKQTTYSGTISGTAYSGLTIEEVNAKQPTLAESDALTQSTGINTEGWYCDSMITNEQSGEVPEFKNKEGKWFSNIHNTAITTKDLLAGDAAKEFAIQGIGNASANSTDSSSVNGGAIELSLNKATSGASYTVSTLDSFIREAGSIDESFTFVISPSDGKVVTAADFDCPASGGQTSAPEDDCFDENAVTFVNQGDANSFGNYGTDNTILVTVPLNFTHGNAAQSIVVNVTGNETEKKYSIKSYYNVATENTTSNDQKNVAFTVTGEPGELVTIDLETGDAGTNAKTFTASSGYDFDGTPPLVHFGGGGKKYYDRSNITDTGNPLTTRVFVVRYRIPSKNIDDTLYGYNNPGMVFIAKASKIITGSANKVYDFSINQTALSPNGETRTLSVSGDPGAQVIVNALDASDEIKGKIRVARVADTNKYKEYEVTNVVDGTGYWKLTVQNDTGSVSPLGTFPNGDDIVVTLYDQSGSAYSGFTSKTYDWDQTTTDSDPGAGKLRGNNTDPESITTLYIDEVDKTAANLDAQFTALKDTGVAQTIIDGPITLTIPTGDGAAGKITQDIEFPLLSSTTTYTVTMTETGANRFDMTNSFSGAVGSAGSRVKTITFNQRSDVTVTFSATTAESNLTIDDNATTSNITSVGKAESESSDVVNLLYVVSSGNNGSITANSSTEKYSFDNTKWTGTLANHQKTLSNGSVVQFKDLKAVMNNNTATITGTAFVYEYGTANDTTIMDVDNFLDVVATAPTATAQSVSTGFNTAKTITLAGTDPQGGNIDFAIASNPSNGTLGSISEGSGLTSTVTYTPTSTFSGTDSFTFTVTDGTTTSSPATVTISVQGQSYLWSVDNRGVADASAACNQSWGTGNQIDTVYASSNNAFASGLRFYTDSALATPYNPNTNGTSFAPNDSHRFILGAPGGSCGYHGIINSIGMVAVVYDCCNT